MSSESSENDRERRLACEISRTNGETPAGTGTPFTGYLLVEVAPPWKYDVGESRRFPEGLWEAVKGDGKRASSRSSRPSCPTASTPARDTPARSCRGYLERLAPTGGRHLCEERGPLSLLGGSTTVQKRYRDLLRG